MRLDTSPEDICGMSAAQGIVTATGGMTSHAAVVGRGMGKTCIVSCKGLEINEAKGFIKIAGKTLKKGEYITVDGASGKIYEGILEKEDASWKEVTKDFFKLVDKKAGMLLLANVDDAKQAKKALDLGAKGIGLCRTEHMFFEEKRIKALRKIILADAKDKQTYDGVIEELLSFQTKDLFEIFSIMGSRPCCIRLLDPPLHEFLPQKKEQIAEIASELAMSHEELSKIIESKREQNPMLGHRGARLAVTFPAIYEMQVRAIARTMAEVFKQGKSATVKIMLPLIMSSKELEELLASLKKVYFQEIDNCQAPRKAIELQSRWGAMIELPRACMIAAQMAPLLDFVSFGTNDLSQTSLGLSRDDSASFLPTYLKRGFFQEDPFQSLDQEGVGALIKIAVEALRKVKPEIELSICGEHGGDPKSIAFFQSLAFDSISCSTFRLPIARLACAKAKK